VDFLLVLFPTVYFSPPKNGRGVKKRKLMAWKGKERIHWWWCDHDRDGGMEQMRHGTMPPGLQFIPKCKCEEEHWTGTV